MASHKNINNGKGISKHSALPYYIIRIAKSDKSVSEIMGDVKSEKLRRTRLCLSDTHSRTVVHINSISQLCTKCLENTSVVAMFVKAIWLVSCVLLQILGL